MKKENVQILKNGGIGVMMTDTIYGILGSALNKKTVERIYQIKGRNKEKPFIILISSIKDLEIFGITVTKETKKILQKYWPGKTSIILPLYPKPYTLYPYLHRGQKSLAFRLPKNEKLISVLKKTGPLVAPSANQQGKEPAMSITEAKKYFGKEVDFYQNGKGSKKPSKIIKVVENYIKVIRL